MKKSFKYLSCFLVFLFFLILCFLLRGEPPITSKEITEKATFATQIQAISNRWQIRALGGTDSHRDFQSSAFYRTIVNNNLFRPLGWMPPRPREPYRLIGTIIPTDASTSKQAILQSTTVGIIHTVSLGETLDTDTTVFDIQSKQVTLEKAGVRRTLHLNITSLLK